VSDWKKWFARNHPNAAMPDEAINYAFRMPVGDFMKDDWAI
jgi:hypothetical protein